MTGFMRLVVVTIGVQKYRGHGTGLKRILAIYPGIDDYKLFIQVL